jgi:hypothetical protein
MERRYHGEAGSGLWRGLPGIVGAEVPEVAFEVSAGEAFAAIAFVGEVVDDGGSGSFGGGVDGVAGGGVFDDEVRGLGLAEVDFGGLGHGEFGGGAVVDGAEHDHAVAEGEFGVGDGVVGASVDGVLLESEGGAEPLDCGCGIVVAEAGDDGGFAGFREGAHGENSAPVRGRLSAENNEFFSAVEDI